MEFNRKSGHFPLSMYSTDALLGWNLARLSQTLRLGGARSDTGFVRSRRNWIRVFLLSCSNIEAVWSTALQHLALLWAHRLLLGRSFIALIGLYWMGRTVLRCWSLRETKHIRKPELWDSVSVRNLALCFTKFTSRVKLYNDYNHIPYHLECLLLWILLHCAAFQNYSRQSQSKRTLSCQGCIWQAS